MNGKHGGTVMRPITLRGFTVAFLLLGEVDVSCLRFSSVALLMAQSLQPSVTFHNSSGSGDGPLAGEDSHLAGPSQGNKQNMAAIYNPGDNGAK